MTTDAIQLRITTDMGALPAAIEFNYQELKGALEQYLAKFDGLMVTEDDIRSAALDRAEINRVARTIARARIDTKKRYLEPFEVFEMRAKELEGLCKAAEGKIAEQLEAFERQRMERKLARLEEMWAGKVAATGIASRHWDLWFDEQVSTKIKGCWLNKGVSEEQAGAAMDAEVSRCVELVGAVEQMYAAADDETREKARREIAATMDLQATLRQVKAFQAERDALAKAAAEAAARREAEKALQAVEAAARAEAAAAAHAARLNAPAAPAAPAPQPAASQPEPEEAPEDDAMDVMVAPVAPAKPPKILSFTARITGTSEQFQQLREAADRIGVAIQRI